MNVDYDVSELNNCKIIISDMNAHEFDELRVILYQLYQYKTSSKSPNPFNFSKIIEQMSK